MHTDATTARGLVTGILARAGVPAPGAAVQADLLVEAELRGHPSHGLLRLRRIVERIRAGVTRPGSTGEHSWRSASLLDVDGGNGLGPIVALRAIAAVVERAGSAGVAVAAIRNADHLGMLAYYAERIARAGRVGIAATTSEALVHPWGGRQALIGTNPLAIGVPAEPDPFVYDSATALVSMGKIHDYAERGQPLPEGWALDAAGEPTTDAAAARAGAIAPFGAAKGYGLGLALELLVATVTGTALGTDVHGTLDSTHPSTKGDLFIVFDAPTGAVAAYLDAIRASPSLVEGSPVTVPGDRSRSRRAASLAHGIDIPDALWEELQGL